MKRVVTTLPALLLVGCVAGPDYRIPPAAIVNRPEAAAPFLGSKDGSVSQAALPPRWWRLYGDPRLDGYVETALAATPICALPTPISAARAQSFAKPPPRGPSVPA